MARFKLVEMKTLFKTQTLAVASDLDLRTGDILGCKKSIILRSRFSCLMLSVSMYASNVTPAMLARKWKRGKNKAVAHL